MRYAQRGGFQAWMVDISLFDTPVSTNWFKWLYRVYCCIWCTLPAHFNTENEGEILWKCMILQRRDAALIWAISSLVAVSLKKVTALTIYILFFSAYRIFSNNEYFHYMRVPSKESNSGLSISIPKNDSFIKSWRYFLF